MINRARDPALDGGVLSYLPIGIRVEIDELSPRFVEEIRLRCGGSCSLTADGENILLNAGISRREMDETVKKMCGGSLYAYSDTINQGYIVMQGGTRVGVCGRAVLERGKITGVYDISSLSVRLAHPAPQSVGEPVCRLLKNRASLGGVLVYSPPGVGKTTLLRAVISKMSSKPEGKRVAVIDTRGELGAFLPKDTLVDLLLGYPRGRGIEIASRTLNPELIVCDEIGADLSEIEAISAAHNSGVPLLASAHAGNIAELKAKVGIKALHEQGVFANYVRISRLGGDYEYSICSRDEF